MQRRFPPGLFGYEFGRIGRQPGLQRGNFAINSRDGQFVLARGGRQGGGIVPFVGIGGLIEDGVELVVLFMRDRVVLMAVALGTAERQTHPDLHGGVGPIFDGGDTYYFPEMADVGKKWDIDIAFLNYAKNPPDIRYYMEEDAIVQAARDLNAKTTIIKHFALWKEAAIDPMPVVERLRSEGFDARLMELGERLDYTR